MTGNKRKSREGQLHVEEETSTRVCACEVILDLQLEILSCLPAQSLLRFRSVCKSWNDMIRRDKFIEKHLARTIQLHKSSSSTNFFLLPTTTSTHDYDLTVMVELEEERKPRVRSSRPLSSKLTFSSSTNGLLCMQFDKFPILIVNPTTNQRLSLRLPSLIPFDTIISLILFGFDDKTKEYKVVIEAAVVEVPLNMIALVCSIPIHGHWPPQPWRPISDPSNMQLNSDFMSPPNPNVVVNGLFHRLSTTMDDDSLAIQSFDLHHEIFGVVSITRPYSGSVRDVDRLALVKVEGCLGLVVMSRHETLHLWKLVDYAKDDSWEQMLSVNSKVLTTLPFKRLGSSLHCLWKGGKLFICFEGRIICCNPETKQCLLRFKADTEADCIPFINSLVSL